MFQQQPAQQVSTLTQEAYQVAVMYNLGIPIAEYRPKFTTRKAISIGFLFVGGLAIFVMALLASSSVRLSGVIALILIGMIGFTSAVWILVDTFLSRDKRVYVCPAGLLYYHHGKTEAIRWDQVESFWLRVVQYTSYGIRTGVSHLYTIRRYDGAQFKFNDQIFNVEALGNTIARETTRLLLPRAIAAYQAGQTITFDQISPNQQGVSNGKERLAWQQVKGMKINRGFLFIQKEDNKWHRWNTIQASQIPNVSVLLALVDSILNSGRREIS